MNADDALDFDLLIAPDAGGYRVRLLSSPAGTASSSFTLPFSDLEIENLVLRMGQVRTGMRRLGSAQTEAAREFGQRLFEALFGDELAACWQSSAAEAAHLGKRLRVRLRLSDAPELLDLPWEYLYDSVANRFVTLSSNTPLVRFLDLPGRVEPMPLSGPLRILALIASPHDVATLDVEHEWNNLQVALADLTARGQVQLDRCPQPTLPELQRTLRRHEVHIFHFVGHGGYDSREQDGMLLFEDEQRRSRPVSGRQLGALLHDEGLLRLAVLNACEGARTSRTDPFAGVGQSLLQQGVPAVIAMQFAITDVAASTFAREFYAAIADGYSVDRSLAEARKSMFAQSDSVEWGTPVLYMRAIEGDIFNLLTPTAPAPAGAPPAPAGAPPAPAGAPPAPAGAASPDPIPAAPKPAPASNPAVALPLAQEVTPATPAPSLQTPLPVVQKAAGPEPAYTGSKRSWAAGVIVAAVLLVAAVTAFIWWRGGARTAPSTSTATQASGAPLQPGTAATGSPSEFRYTFDDGDAVGWTGDPADWTVVQDEAGNYVYQGAAPPERETASELPSKEAMSTWRTYTVHLRLRAIQPGSNPDLAEFWLTTHAPLESVTGCTIFNTFLDFRKRIVELGDYGYDSSCEHTLFANTPLPSLELDQWHDLLVSMQEDRMQVTVDAEEVLDVPVDAAQGGYVYLNVGNGAIVQFDEVAVQRFDE